MRMHIEQKGYELTGFCVMENTTYGNIEGTLNGNLLGGKLAGIIIGAAAVTVDFEGTCQGDAINGSYHSETVGRGTFTLNRQ